MIKREDITATSSSVGIERTIELAGHALAWSTFLIKRGTSLQHLAVSGSKELSKPRTCTSMEHHLD